MVNTGMYYVLQRDVLCAPVGCIMCPSGVGVDLGLVTGRGGKLKQKLALVYDSSN